MLPDSSSEPTVVDSATSQDQTGSASADTGTQDSSVAASSTAEAKPAETILDRVKAVVNKTAGVSPTSIEPESPASADPDSKAAESDELSEEELKGLHVKTQQRFGSLTSKLKAKDGEIASLAPKAAEYDKIDTFIRNAGLTPKDVGNTFEIAALLRSDKRAAREKLLPLMAALDRELGETLPPELQARVDNGYLTLDDAQALNRSAADARLSRAQRDEIVERQNSEAAATAVKTKIDSTISTIEKWEKQRAEKDPDWQSKRKDIADQVELAIGRKARDLKDPDYFPTPEETLKFSKDAEELVNKQRKRFSKPTAIDPPVTAGASPRSIAAPKSTLDIVRRIATGAA